MTCNKSMKIRLSDLFIASSEFIHINKCILNQLVHKTYSGLELGSMAAQQAVLLAHS